jgi:hypothetical protein
VLPSSKVLFPEGASAEQIVKMTLFVLQAHHQRETERLAEILSGIDEVHIQKLALLWEELSSRLSSENEALATLTKIIAAELDSGDSPLLLSR